MKKKKKISIVVPVFNEQDNIEPFHARVTAVMKGLAARYTYEILFTDNHSTDSTFARLRELAARDKRVRAIRFSRNFGYQRSILTGYLNARGEAAIQLDVDLQDPPEMAGEFLKHWEQGYKVVYGIRRSRRENWFINLVRKVFYRLIHYLSEEELPLDAGDFRLIDREIIEQLRLMEDSNPYIRGTVAGLGFKQIGVPYDRAERERGESKFSVANLASLAIDGILNHSVIPLRMATFTGILVSLLTLGGVVMYSAGKLMGYVWPPGFATTTILLLLGISLNGLFLGVIGEYLGRIYRQVKRRPLTIVEAELGDAPFRER